MSKELEYVSNIDTLCGAEQFRYMGGKADGTAVVVMYNRKIRLEICPDRALDIIRAEHMGEPFSFTTKNGMVSSKLYSDAAQFCDVFGGGLLYTCGLDNIGTPELRGSRQTVQHGNLSYIPCQNVNINRGYEKDGIYAVSVSGEMRYTSLFGNNLALRRTIKLRDGEERFTVEDKLVNNGFSQAEYMIMYHCNFGYPLLCENTTVETSAIESTEFVDAYAERNSAAVFGFEAPTPDRHEEVFSHKLRGGNAEISISNGKKRVTLGFSADQLPYFMQWKSMASGDYALGIEPSVTGLKNRKSKVIAAGECHDYKLTFTVKEL